MTEKEAIYRIREHMRVHHIGEYPHIYLAEALEMAIEVLKKNCKDYEPDIFDKFLEDIQSKIEEDKTQGY